MPTIFQILVSLALLFAGRRVFWFVVAVLGFYAGMQATPLFIDAPSQSLTIAISLGCGLLMAVAAFILQKLAIGISGFIVGGYGAFLAMSRLGIHLGKLNWVPIVCAGLLGVVLSSIVFEWALIVISAVAGAYLLVMTLGVSDKIQPLVFVLVAVAGFLIQAKDKSKKKPEKKKEG